MAANGCALFRYTMTMYLQKLTQVIKSITSGFQRIKRQEQENTKKNTKKTTEINWDCSKKIS